MLRRRRSLALVLAVLTWPSMAAGTGAASDDRMIGLWAAHWSDARSARGELTLVRARDAWTATIAGSRVRFTASGDSLRFALPGDRGGFRGAWHGSGNSIEGFWLEPAPAGSAARAGPYGQAFATPIALRPSARGGWRGTVRPLDESRSLYLRVSRGPDGALEGAFREPGTNSTGGAWRFRLAERGDSAWFLARVDSFAPELRVDAMLARPRDRLLVHWPEAGRVLELVRAAPARASELVPRLARDTAYVYRVPSAGEDGWGTARARAVGMDEPALASVVQRLIREDVTARRPSLVHSLLVARHGRLVLEEYFFGYGRDRPHDLRSAGKTFASVLLGAVMLAGVRVSPETPVYGLVAGMGPFAEPDPRKARITLAQLMTHTSGLACDDNDDASPGGEDTMQRQAGSPDWWRYTLSLPVAHDPGSRYAYCSGGMNLVGAALGAATGRWLPELFDRILARPLQFGPYHWNLMPTGDGYLGGGAYLRPRDLLKVGQLYLSGGRWHGQRVVDSSWVALSTAPHVEISPATTGLDSSTFRNFYVPGADGYAWHLHTLHHGGADHADYEAAGNGGQLLIVVPDLDLAVVLTGGNYGQGGVWAHWRDRIVADEILPAIAP